ncbi:MAG TPA: glycosyltransferase [Pyrinomonadaceae bacterium]|nr:glycosyltransferase [Pyrinomonadaceae bacterium]
MAAMLESLLIIGSKRTGAIENAFARAFGRLGVPLVDHFDLEQSSRPFRQNRVINRLTLHVQHEFIGRNLFRHLKNNSQRYDAVIVFKGMQLTPAWLARCKTISKAGAWVNYNPDDPFNLVSRGATNQNVVNSIGHYDIYATWARRLIPSIQKAGCESVIYLPFAYDKDNHFPEVRRREELEGTVTFIGGWDAQREQVLTEVAEFDLKIYGEGWDRINSRSPLRGKAHPFNIYGEELRQVVTSSKASINILRPQNYGSHNMRTFEIPAMRGLMITTSSEEQNSFFPSGQSCLMYEDAQDLRNKLRLLMEGAFDIESMKESAYEHRQGNSYDERAAILHESIAAYCRNRIAA